MPTLVDDELSVEDRFWVWAEENYPHDVDMMDDIIENPDEFENWFNPKKEEFLRKIEGDFATQPAHLDYSFEGKDTQNYREIVISIPDKFKKVDFDYVNMVHHPESKNQIAHVRLADVEQADDVFTRTLLVDEIQSDAHQSATGKGGRGYLTVEQANEKALKRKELKDRQQQIINSDISEAEKDKLIDELLIDAEIDAQTIEPFVPELPLKKDKQWGAVGLRQAMKVAAEEGYDQVALTTGRLQAERNRKIGDISEAILYKRHNINTGKPAGWALQGVSTTDEFDDFLVIFDTYEEAVQRLPKILGKENAEKLLASTPDDAGDFAIKQPMTFKEGGKKYMDFYDRTLQKIWKRDFADKYGVDIKMVEYKQGDETVQLPTLKMTEKMRADILKGLKMFAEGGYVVESGDTLSEIAQREGMTISEIAKLNNIKDINKIYVGQSLRFDAGTDSDISKKAEMVEKAEPVEVVEQIKKPETEAKTTGKSKTVEALKKNKRKQSSPIIPLNMRAFLGDIFGMGKDINENSLTKAEREELRKVVQRAQSSGKDRIEYIDYGTQGEKGSQYADVGGGGSAVDFLGKVADPSYSLKTTLGQAKISKDEKGNTIVTDKYNFNDSDGEFSVLGLIKGIKNAGLSPYAQIRNIAREFGSGKGEGAEVKINLGKIDSQDIAKLEAMGDTSV
jgi:nucleoid-associated protein YgaU